MARRRRSHLGAPAAFRSGVRHALAIGLNQARKGDCARAHHSIKAAAQQMKYLTMRPGYMSDADHALADRVENVRRKLSLIHI